MILRKLVALASASMLMMSIFLVIQLLTPSIAAASSHIYPDDFPGQTLQQAINNDTHVHDGDTIYVKEGTWHVSLNVNKSLTVRGMNRDNCILEGFGKDVGGSAVVEVTATDVKISRFTIRNGRWGM